MRKKTLVILSGGQDSTTCLFWAIDKFGKENVESLTFDYGQKHKIEIKSAQKIAEYAQINNKIISINTFSEFANNALLNNEISTESNVNNSSALPNTFVPGRNLIFITYAAAYAWNKIAAESDNETAKGNLQYMLSMMSSEQITRGESLYAKLTKQVELKKESKRGREHNLKSDAKIIEAALVKDSSKEFSELTQEDLEKLTFLRIDEPIKDVSSVARFTQLDRLVIVNGQISDATPLAKLENLEWISFEITVN